MTQSSRQSVPPNMLHASERSESDTGKKYQAEVSSWQWVTHAHASMKSTFVMLSHPEINVLVFQSRFLSVSKPSFFRDFEIEKMTWRSVSVHFTCWIFCPTLPRPILAPHFIPQALTRRRSDDGETEDDEEGWLGWVKSEGDSTGLSSFAPSRWLPRWCMTRTTIR